MTDLSGRIDPDVSLIGVVWRGIQQCVFDAELWQSNVERDGVLVDILAAAVRRHAVIGIEKSAKRDLDVIAPEDPFDDAGLGWPIEQRIADLRAIQIRGLLNSQADIGCVFTSARPGQTLGTEKLRA